MIGEQQVTLMRAVRSGHVHDHRRIGQARRATGVMVLGDREVRKESLDGGNDLGARDRGLTAEPAVDWNREPLPAGEHELHHAEPERGHRAGLSKLLRELLGARRLGHADPGRAGGELPLLLAAREQRFGNFPAPVQDVQLERRIRRLTVVC